MYQIIFLNIDELSKVNGEHAVMVTWRDKP